jgi:hypothetical protein
MLEAKGGKSYVNPLAKGAAGRQIGNGIYAVQGTREYVQAVAELMRTDSDPAVAAVGDAIVNKIVAGEWGQIEYYLVTSKWAGARGIGRGLAVGVSKIARVFRLL